MYKCPDCGCEEFYGHQKVITTVKVVFDDYDNVEVLEEMEGSEAIDEPEGPYECVSCGTYIEV